MALYLPGMTGLLAAAIAWGVAVVLLLIGTAAAGRNAALEVRMITGWGVLCVVLTLWGVFVPASLRIPAAAIVTAAGQSFHLALYDSLYIPRGSSIEITAKESVDVAEFSADVAGDYRLKFVPYADVTSDPSLRFKNPSIPSLIV